MKTILSTLMFVALFGCSSGSASTNKTDTMNSIDYHDLDTERARFPNGYAPPNTKMDTSQGIKDSMNARHKKDSL